MSHTPRRAASVPALLVALVLAAPAAAQAERPWARWFGPRPAAEKPAAPAPTRLTEIQVEVAWLADPLTFPYYLEAHVAAGKLEVRGYVPNRAVHDQALNLARVYSALPVVDALKEHASLLVRPGHMPAAQLQSSVVSALREALPRSAAQLTVQCGTDGKVTVGGTVPTHDERLAVSHALRRLYGCTSVQNRTRVPGDTAPAPAAPALAKEAAPKRPPVKTPPAWDGARVAAKTPAEPAPQAVTAAADGPRLETPAPASASAPADEAKPPAPPPPASPAVAARVKQRIEEACPGAKGVKIDVVSPTEFRIEITAASEEQVGTFAGKILELPELQDYRAELSFKVMP